MNEYKIESRPQYPFNFEVTQNGGHCGYFQDLDQALLFVKNTEGYPDIGAKTIDNSSPEEKHQNASGDQLAAIRVVIKETVQPLKKSYGELFNLCTDYFVGDVSAQQFRKELRAHLGISIEEAVQLNARRRFKK